MSPIVHETTDALIEQVASHADLKAEIGEQASIGMFGEEIFDRRIEGGQFGDAGLLDLVDQAENVIGEMTMNPPYRLEGEVFLAAEMIVETPLRDAASFYDLVDAGRGIALRAKKRDRLVG